MEKKHILIFNPKLARYLLKQGFKVVDIKPNREILNASVFIFLNSDGFWDKVNEFKDKQ